MAKVKNLNIDMKIVSQQLQEIRAEKNWSQSKMAKEIGIDPSTINKYESGTLQMSQAMLTLICKKLNVPLPRLMSGVGPTLADAVSTIINGFCDQFNIIDRQFLESYISVDEETRTIVNTYFITMLEAAKVMNTEQKKFKKERDK